MKFPDPKLTPGEGTNQIIPRNVPYSRKVTVYKAYNISLLKRLFYVIDHLIPLEIGGTNNLLNLWPQPRLEARLKDKDENFAARNLRENVWTYIEAQAWILDKWTRK